MTSVLFHDYPFLSNMNFVGRRLVFLGLAAALMLALSGCGAGNRSGKSYVIKGQRYHILASAEGFNEKGLASWYGNPFHGRKTASGEVYDMYKISAAHKTLPLQTWVEVKNLENNQSMVLRVNDRGPFIKGRIIDLSQAAAKELGVLNAGLARVSVTAITGERTRQLAAQEAAVNARVAAAKSANQKTKPKVAAKNTPKPAASSKKVGYGVHVASTTDSHEAGKLLAALKKDYAPVSLQTSSQNGAIKFSIYIDGLTNEKSALAIKQQLTKRGYRESRVVQRTVNLASAY